MLVRVQALLAKAEATEFSEEAEALTVKATELMVAYNIDAALIAAKAEVREKPEGTTTFLLNPYGLQKAILYSNLVSVFGGQAIRLSTKGDVKLKVYGFPNDMFAVEVLYTSLSLQVASQSKNVPSNVHGKTWRTSFWQGFTASVITRLKEAKETTEKQATADEPGTAIILRSRSLEVAEMFRQAHPRTRTSTSTYTSSSGFNAGYAAGTQANLHNQRGVPARRRSISS